MARESEVERVKRSFHKKENSELVVVVVVARRRWETIWGIKVDV